MRLGFRRDDGDPFVVDLAFYGVDWLTGIAGSPYDSYTCFSPVGAAASPARKNILTGDTREAGDQWNAGQLTVEESCAASNSFALDFDDSGIGGDPRDGTDWGQHAGLGACGASFGPRTGGQWLLWHRQVRCDRSRWGHF